MRAASLPRYVCVALALAASGCAITTTGEFTALACSNRDDDDGDKLKDCDDPDCWVFCPAQMRTDIGGPASGMKADAGGDSGEPLKMPDASTPRPMPDDDAGSMMPGPDGEDDAGAVEPPSECNCIEGEVCADGKCKPGAVIEGDYMLSIRSAYVPLGRTSDTCFDYTVIACTMRILLCDCERPDPYVDVLLNSKPIFDAMTPEVLNNQNPVWPAAPSVRVSLKATDTLTFAAFDADGIGGQDQPIFSCSPDLSSLATGSDVLSCNPKPGTTVRAPLGTNYYITAQARKIVPDASVP